MIVKVGDSIPSQRFHVTRADLIRYAGASGDFNPIHWNERLARSAGLPGVIAHGMFTMATAIRALTDWTGDPGAVVEYAVRFSRPVVVPDPGTVTIAVSGHVCALRPQDLVDVDMVATVDDDVVLSKAQATVRLRSAEVGRPVLYSQKERCPE